MNNDLYKKATLCASAAFGLGLVVPLAQSATAAAGAERTELEEVIVTARRKEESLQDVPTTINAVTGSEIEKLNIRKFEDIASIVPGLSMSTEQSGVTASASVRGVNYDGFASGNNGTVEFYLNDAPISAGNLFQAIYDIQQVELLRGPQGTLRGRASPSGSITVTTRRPDLSEFDGYVSATGNNIGGYNGQGAVNFPVIDDKLAVRVAGAYDRNEVNRVHSLNNSEDPESKTKSGRLTALFEPTDSLSFLLTAQKTKQDIVSFDQVISQQAINPSAPVVNAAIVPLFNVTYAPPSIRAGSRLSVEVAPRVISQDYNNYNFQAQWAFAGQKLNYVGARNEQRLASFAPADLGGYFSPLAPAVYQGYGQRGGTRANSTAHELRLSSEERIAGMFDYIVGAFYQKFDSATDLTRPTPVFNPSTTPFTQFVNQTAVSRRGGNEEKSGYFNLTAHLGDALELSGGARYIKYEAQGTLSVGGSRLAAADEDSSTNTTIYMGSVKYNFTEDLMAYATVGTSWRPGISVIGDFSLARSALENSFLILDPEKSTSYEVGFKSTFLDKRLRTNVSVYHQKFTNNPYRSASGVWFVESFLNTALTPPAVAQRPTLFNFVAAVPVEVNGAEAAVDFSVTPDWDVGAVAAVSKGEIKSGFAPCNDFAPHDGIPDTLGTNPTLATLQAAVGPGQTISGCTVTQRSSSAPEWSASLQSEYRLPITAAMNSFVRGQVSIYGNSQNDPTNRVDDYENYALLNLYAGLRDSSGAWEVALYGKNVTDTERVLKTSSAALTTPLNAGAVPTNYYGGDATSGVVMTAPREFGLSLRYAFGSR
jgi:iron complex outermembrane receptor protein